MDVASKTEIGWVDDFVCGWVRQDGLCVDTSLVGEGAETGNVVVEWDVDLDGLGDQVLEISELLQLVLAHDVVTVGNNHTGHQSTERGDTVSLTDTENGGVDMCGTGLEGAVGVGDGASGIVVEMGLNVARNNTTEGSDEIVNLSRAGASDGIGNTLYKKVSKKIA